MTGFHSMRAVVAALFVGAAAAGCAIPAVKDQGRADNSASKPGATAAVAEDADPRVAALASPDRMVRLKALTDLYKGKHPRIVAFLLAATKDEYFGNRSSAVVKIGDLKPPPPEAFETVVALLSDENAKVRYNAAYTLGRYRDARSVPPLAAALRDSDREVRAAASECLAAIDDYRIVVPLARSTRDSYIQVRTEAYNGLSRVRDPRAVEPLIATLADRTPLAREGAANGLGKIGDRRAVEPLIAILKDPDILVRSAVATALGDLKDSRAVGPLGRLLLSDPENMVCQNVASALGNLGDRRAADDLIKALGGNWLVAEKAAISLAALKDDALVARLTGLLGDRAGSSPDLRLGIARALGEMKDPRGVEPLIASVREDPAIRPEAIRALGMIKDSRAVEPLVNAFKDPLVLGDAVRALGEIGDPSAVEPLANYLRDGQGNHRIRSDAAEALGKIKDPRAVDALVSTAGVWGAVGTNATEALGAIGDPRAVEPLIRLMFNVANIEEAGRAHAARALGEIKDPRAVEPLIRALSDRKSDVSSAAHIALIAITGVDFGYDVAAWRRWREQNQAAFPQFQPNQ